MVYNRDSAGNEYYSLARYARHKDGYEIYALKANGDEFYLKNRDGTEVMARIMSESGSIPYFARTSDQIPICPILHKNQESLRVDIAYYRTNQKGEIYPKRDNREYYIDDGRKMIYAKNEKNEEYYATVNNKPYYATKILENGDRVQYAITDASGKPKYIEENDIYIYPINITKNVPIYPVDATGKQIYLEKNNKQYYGFNTQRLPVYAKEQNHDDYFALDNKVPYYSFYEINGEQYQYYPKLKTKRQFYLKIGNKEIYAKFKSKERYAKSENAKDDILAVDNNIQYYATNENSIEVYPEARQDQYYREENLVEKVAVNKTNQEGFYAKTQESEFYPKNFNDIPEVKPEIVEFNVHREPTEDEIMNHIN